MDIPDNAGDPAPPSGPARLDYYVRRRCAQMRIGPRELARRGGPNRTTLHKAINGTGRLRESTLIRIDTALGWAEGSAAVILSGGHPQTRIAAVDNDDLIVTVLNAALTMLGDATDLLVNTQSLLQELVGDDLAEPVPAAAGGA
ncbi:transcriptional regulator [Mycolicibacterium wolinskyi]|uniref:transcriptional regulator n=1 Tax=Mycolicibacterium wolinskyi TaxID=59750 RepID=UPI0008318EC6|nr:transcriptional regulator [Mycolicibacterium wolinskyi]